MSYKKHNHDEDKKFAIYEASGKYYIKHEGEEEREINRSLYLHYKDVKEKQYKKKMED